MDWSWNSIASKIVDVAPTLAEFATNPVGSVAKKAVSLIAEALGVEETPAAIEAALASDPEALSKLKIAESNNAVEMRRIALEETQAYLLDTQSARGRQVEHEKAMQKTDVNLYLLAWLVVAGFFGLIGLLCFKALPEDSNGVIFMLFGSLSTGFGQVLGYFFGSSKSSSDKTGILAGKAKS